MEYLVQLSAPFFHVYLLQCDVVLAGGLAYCLTVTILRIVCMWYRCNQC